MGVFDFLKKSNSKSLSERTEYPQFCEQASRDESIFKSFRRNPVYNYVLEHVSQEQGQVYLNLIKDDRELMVALDGFKENDLYGDPALTSYPETGLISTTTLRYIKVLSDLKKLFGSLDGFKICEIGIGYGGQCRIIESYFNLSSYTLVDIEPALNLSKKYLSNFQLSNLEFKTMDELLIKDYGLVISNYAFTELPKAIQDDYIEKVIKSSKRGYITYNQGKKISSYNKEELRQMFGARILDEIPLTAKDNCIIAW